MNLIIKVLFGHLFIYLIIHSPKASTHHVKYSNKDEKTQNNITLTLNMTPKPIHYKFRWSNLNAHH